ncbi:thiazolylpeptide-type bacteriocin [Streptacidiphilus sp. P02-A3a]|uniref:thiazolylpeptide-type bacteriocin n=1 Tax=Streptacidiphilus sp. P02-A3a TaxID=2704468 RepID=UPI0015FC3B05|nr:thiazolylpeptide-type bacteriocin [Streptacidiphilus sp. P02-A3a]QMU71736.1 thiazolylpeptide-type bacteriocin [Streptacidiphilus sp. P02-A3a]
MASNNTALASLTQEILELESDTFEIADYEAATETMNGSTCSSTCSSCGSVSKN